jgi:CelD/BcsL family acetyltransferase involved in cellulose biosynthesis
LDAAPSSSSEQGHPLFEAHQGWAGLEHLTPEWTRLAASLSGAKFLHFPGWYRAYLASKRCDPASVWFIAAHRGTRLVAVFPLQFQRHRVILLQPRYLGTIDDDELQLSDFVFERTDDNATLLRELTSWLRRQRALQWDVLRLMKVADDSLLTYAASRHRPALTLAARYDASAYFDTRGTYEQATRAMKAKFKSNLRRRARLAQNAASLRFQCCRRQDELELAFPLFLDVEESGWKGPAGASSAILCRPTTLAFYSEMVREFGARNECAIHLLWHGEQVIAAQLGLQIGRTLYILKVGYRDVNPIYAPGILLQERTIRHACEDPDIDVLSMVNDPHWARSFRPDTVGVCMYFAPNRTVRGVLTMLGLYSKRALKRLLPRSPASTIDGD